MESAFAKVTRGPGATSSVNGVAYALLDRLPLLMFTDCVANKEKRRQRVEQQKLFEPVTKWSGVLTPVDLGESLRNAIALAAPRPQGQCISTLTRQPGWIGRS